MKRSPINKRSKKNKHRHVSNKRIDHSLEFIPCDVCQWVFNDELPMAATSTHEVFHNGSAYMRNTSIDYKAQVRVCGYHHRALHANNHNLDKRLKQKHQQRIMSEYNMDMDQFIEIFGKNHIVDI